jgi:hypothetical protein
MEKAMRSRGGDGHQVRLLAVVVFLAALTVAVSARADSASSERTAYVDRLETICKPGVAATQGAVEGVRSDVQAERLAVAAGKLGKAARIFDGTVGRISAVPRPAPDARQLAKWFGYLRLQESYLAKAADALRAKRISSYQHNSVRFVHNGNLANDVVIAFGFNYCRFNFSRFN